MSTNGPGRGPAAHHPPRIGTLGLAIALGLAAIPAAAVPGLAADPSSSPGPEVVTLIAEGPFGRVEGVATGADGAVPDPSDLPVLDAWARGTTLVVRPTIGTLAPWRAVAIAEPALDPSSAVELGGGDGDAIVELPTSGLFLVRIDATIRPDGGALEGSWWWRIAVPDRDLPEGETGPPPPAIQLASGEHVESLEQGSGCFLGTCGDIGRVSPPEQLPTVRSIPGAALSIALSDGSGVTAWSIVATPVDGDQADEILLGRAHDTWTTQGWVTAPALGDWAIGVSVTFDRERGTFDGYGRLLVEPP